MGIGIGICIGIGIGIGICIGMDIGIDIGICLYTYNTWGKITQKNSIVRNL